MVCQVNNSEIKLIEKKMNRDMKYAQKRTFELLDRLLRIADPKAEFYRGLYTVKLPLVKKIGKIKCEVCGGSGYTDRHMDDEDFNVATFIVKDHQNGSTTLMNAEQFLTFLEDRDL
jgi:hypothetical protein